MFELSILFPSILNGLTTGAVYALIALGLTLIYGVLHIINFAHGASLMLALYAVYLLKQHFGLDPYLALPILVPGMFALGYALQRLVINRASHGKDENILLVTLGISIVMENLALLFFKSDTRTIDTAYTLTTVAVGPAMIALPKLVAFAGALVTLALLVSWWLKNSRFGAWLQAVRDNEDAARAIGVNPFNVKMGAIALSGGFMGAAGAFYVQVFQYIDPGIAYGSVTSVEALVAAIVGGIGTVWGPVLGALVLHVLADLTRNLFGQLPGINMVIYGVVLVLIVMFLPRGIAGIGQSVVAVWKRSGGRHGQ